MKNNDSTAKYNIGEHIKIGRKSLGLRQTDLAKKAGVTASHLSDIERGVAIPTIPTLHKIGDALNRPLEYFFQEISNQPQALGMVFHEKSIGGRAVSKFVKLVKENSKGAVNLHIYHQAKLGSAKDQITSLLQGGIHLFIDEPQSFEYYSEICGPVFLPYFFNDREHYYRFLKSAVFDENIYRPLLEKGIRILNPQSHWECGNYELLFSNTPIFSPSDLIGKKMRTYSSESAIELRKILGAEPVIVEWEKVYDAFESGKIDVLLCPSSYFNMLNFHKIANYATFINYGYTVNLHIAMNEKEYSKLRPSVQQALIDATEKTGSYCSELANRQTTNDLKNLSAKNRVPVIYPDEILWRRAFKDAIEKICSKGFLNTGLYDKIQQL
jgi:TRAP-type transport system periplasmic protein